MEFWGIEVPAGKPVTCVPGEGMYLHVSQAALGEGKGKSEGNKAVLSVEVDATKVVLGTLYQGKCDQISLDLVFDRDFVVSHTGSSVSMYLCGYRTEAPQDEYPFSITFLQWIHKYTLKTVVGSLVAAGNWIEMFLKPQLHIIYYAFQ
jgi:hypothetical protein